ncbi:MAG: methyltransferase domain-containing protein [Kordiimonadaceae bacterium]|nr:methyltransferase domain-containing protein [Kordiimonadaceae bacterium]MBT6036741.1 methyltransferase domain-containing protein [Kordiimonadaceae bacterium]MBT6328379.1 methyltransferase domain-containing protein [Kordiimonadaceae bacterium]MBT7583810.1 methyltransferase domain-containing protein [Kordiimonadaceae bacterium]
MSGNENTVKVPLKWRMKAWWEGYDLDDIRERLARGENIDEADLDKAPEAPEKQADAPEAMEWDDKRLETTQLIWGEGYCGPGGSEYVTSMSKLLGMTSKMSVAVIGAGLGGPSRVLASEFGAWITGYEQSDVLATKGMALSTKAGLEGKAPIQHFNPADVDPFERTFDRAYSKEALYTVEDKPKLLADVYGKLKDGGLFLINDYTLSGVDALANLDVQKWLRQEPTQPYPVPNDTMEKLLTDCGFMVRVNEDITDAYVEMIARSWSGVDKVIESLTKQDDDHTETIQRLIKEAEYWMLRSKTMKEGHVKAWRFLVYKPSEVK